jgi:hypothetical protein
MWRRLLTAWAGALGLLSGGCLSSGPLEDNPILVRMSPPECVANPVLIELPFDHGGYTKVYERTRSVLCDYFEIAAEDRRWGHFQTHPRIAPGYEQSFKAGSPSPEERLLATLQTIRNYAIVQISADSGGGYFVDVKVFKEMEDLPAPTRATAGAAIFRSEPTIQRQYEVIEPIVTANNWIPLGRDEALEQAILQKLKKCM